MLERMLEEVRIGLLGGLTLAGAPLRLRTRKTESLLAYLALRPGDHRRDDVVAMFWGDEPQGAARQKLRLALTSIRGELGDFLVADRSRVRIEGIRTDVADLGRALTTASGSELLAAVDEADAAMLPESEDSWLAAYRTGWEEKRTLGCRRAISDPELGSSDLIRVRERLHDLDPDDRENTAELYRLYRKSIRRDRSGRAAARALVERHPWIAAAEEPSDYPIPAGPTDRFVGRDADLARLADLLLADREPCWTTVRGPGGVGKTRLARELLRQAPRADVRPVFVGLSDVTDGREARARAEAALFPSGQAGGSLDLLPPTLLVLDNLEQITDPSPLAELVRPGLSLRVLATSQRPLSFPTEITIELGPLQGPDRNDPATWAGAESVRLLVDRAAAVTGDRAVPLDAAVAVCLRLEGHPLALELAASALDLMDLPTLARTLAVDAAALDLRRRDREPRQRSLRDSVEWSLKLLPPEAREALVLLSAVPTSLDADGIAAVLGRADNGVIRLLRDRSLLARIPGSLARFELPRSVREVVSAESNPEGRGLVARRLTEFHFERALNLPDPSKVSLDPFVPDLGAMADAARRKWREGDVRRAFDAVDRLSCAWIVVGPSVARPELVEEMRAEFTADSGGLWWRSAFILARLATVREDVAEAQKWAEFWRDEAPPEHPILRAHAAAHVAFAWAELGDPVRALVSLEELRDDDDPSAYGQGILRQMIGRCHEARSRSEEAEAAYRDSIAAMPLDEGIGIRSHTLLFLSGLLWAEGRTAEARDVLDRSEAGFLEANEPFRRPEVLRRRTWICDALDESDRLRDTVAEMVALAQSSARPDHVRWAVAGGAMLARRADPCLAASLGMVALPEGPTRLLSEVRERELLKSWAEGHPTGATLGRTLSPRQALGRTRGLL